MHIPIQFDDVIVQKKECRTISNNTYGLVKAGFVF